ncbi:hypothetical protein GCM10023259_023470 [Thermocatellispora tengchongensis]
MCRPDPRPVIMPPPAVYPWECHDGTGRTATGVARSFGRAMCYLAEAMDKMRQPGAHGRIQRAWPDGSRFAAFRYDHLPVIRAHRDGDGTLVMEFTGA